MGEAEADAGAGDDAADLRRDVVAPKSLVETLERITLGSIVEGPRPKRSRETKKLSQIPASLVRLGEKALRQSGGSRNQKQRGNEA
jgi:hypothetical protein